MNKKMYTGLLGLSLLTHVSAYSVNELCHGKVDHPLLGALSVFAYDEPNLGIIGNVSLRNGIGAAIRIPCYFPDGYYDRKLEKWVERSVPATLSIGLQVYTPTIIALAALYGAYKFYNSSTQEIIEPEETNEEESLTSSSL